MRRKSTITIILFIALISFITLGKLGFESISRIGMGIFTIVALIVSLPDIKAMNKHLLATVMTITLIPAFVFIYSMFFSTKDYMIYGSLICFIISFPISIVVIYKSKNKLS